MKTAMLPSFAGSAVLSVVAVRADRRAAGIVAVMDRGLPNRHGDGRAGLVVQLDKVRAGGEDFVQLNALNGGHGFANPATFDAALAFS